MPLDHLHHLQSQHQPRRMPHAPAITAQCFAQQTSLCQGHTMHAATESDCHVLWMLQRRAAGRLAVCTQALQALPAHRCLCLQLLH